MRAAVVRGIDVHCLVLHRTVDVDQKVSVLRRREGEHLVADNGLRAGEGPPHPMRAAVGSTKLDGMPVDIGQRHVALRTAEQMDGRCRQSIRALERNGAMGAQNRIPVEPAVARGIDRDGRLPAASRVAGWPAARRIRSTRPS